MADICGSQLLDVVDERPRVPVLVRVEDLAELLGVRVPIRLLETE